jgi:hypothetical protein
LLLGTRRVLQPIPAHLNPKRNHIMSPKKQSSVIPTRRARIVVQDDFESPQSLKYLEKSGRKNPAGSYFVL